MDKSLLESCKKLHFGSGLVAKTKKIKADIHLDFCSNYLIPRLKNAN